MKPCFVPFAIAFAMPAAAQDAMLDRIEMTGSRISCRDLLESGMAASRTDQTRMGGKDRPLMDGNTEESPSFRKFRDGLQRLVA